MLYLPVLPGLVTNISILSIAIGFSFTIPNLTQFKPSTEPKEIDEEGKLKRTLNGFEMLASHTADEVIDRVKMHLDITEIQEQTGVDRLEASKQWLLQKMAKEA